MVTDSTGREHRPAGAFDGGQFAPVANSAPTTQLQAEGDVPMAPVGHETREWTPKAPELYSRAEVTRQTGTYESTLTPPIAPQQIALPAALSADVEDAARALVDFDTFAQRTLGTDDPALGPMASILLRTESASSSQIEMLTTSAKQIALAEIDEGERRNALEVVGNVRAMEAALRLSKDIDQESILDMHYELLRHSSTLAAWAGKYREELVWIGGDNAGPIGASFVAQQHEHVRASVQDVVEFARRTDLPAIAQVAIAHAQFETIHPFVDGNGRTGRALAQAMIRNLGLATHTTVPVSAGLLVNTETYFDALTAYREGDAAPIIRRFADASRYAAAYGRELVHGLAAELSESAAKLRGVRSDSRAFKVLPLLVGQPVVNVKYLKSALGLSDMTAGRALETLVQHGVVAERSGMQRNRVWEHTGILSVLDEYAARIRRSAHH